ncbi:MAG TPA: hypothetical protein ENF87_01640 [Thermoproteales archaeon]|nr:hypothetical protein [Thermoproteales archaeon]
MGKDVEVYKGILLISVMDAIILAGGKGEKLHPFSYTRPKAMIPVGNIPIIGHQLNALRESGVKRVAIVLGGLGNQVVNYVEKVKGDLEVAYYWQEKPKGTADALLKAKDWITEDFLVLYGDVLISSNSIKKLVEKFKTSDAFSVLLVEKPKREEYYFGVSLKEDLVRKVQWWGGDDARICGIFAFEQNAIEYIQRNPGIMRSVTIGIMPPLEAELNQSVAEMIEDGKKVLAVEVVDYFEDVDKPWEIIYANMKYYEFKARRLKESVIGKNAYISDKAVVKAPVYLEEGAYIGDNVVINAPTFLEKGAKVDNGAIIDGAIIGKYSRVERYSEVRAVIGKNVRIGHAAEVCGVIFDKVYILHYSEVCGVIGENTDIGAATVVGTLRFDSERQVVKIKGKRYRGESVAFIGDYCRTGVNAILMPGVRVGPYSIIGPGVVLYEDLEPYKMVLVKQELVKRDWGPDRYGW